MSLEKLVEEITRPILQEGVNDPGILKAVFLAGGPGSGKGYVSKGLFGIPKSISVSAYGLKVVNQDKALTVLLKKYGYGTDLDDMPDELFKQLTDPDYEDYSGMRSYAKDITAQQKKQYMNGRLGLIIDGTGHKYGKIKEQKKELEDIGYDTYMVFVHTDLDIAQKRNMERPRKLNPELVETYWKDVQKNLIVFQGLFGNANFMMVNNSDTLSEKAAQKKFKMLVKKGIDKFIKKPVKNHLGKKWIAKQKIMKEIAIVGADGVIQGDTTKKKVKKNKTNSMGGYKKVTEKMDRKTQLKYNKLHKKRMELIRKYGGFGSQAGSYKLKMKINDLEKQMKKLNEDINEAKVKRFWVFKKDISKVNKLIDKNVKFDKVKKLKGSGKEAGFYNVVGGYGKIMKVLDRLDKANIYWAVPMGNESVNEVIQPSKAYGFYKLEKGKKIIQFKGSKSAARSEIKKARKKDPKGKYQLIQTFKKGVGDIFEEKSNIKKVVGIYGGRFQPFGPHHLKTFKWLEAQVDEAYITTTDIKKPPRHPMNYKEKVRHMVKMGVPANRIVKEKVPYVAKNTLKKYDKDTTAVIYIFGKKDAGRLAGGTKKSGGKTYYQDYKKNKGNLEGFETHGYILTAPHVSVNVGGKEVSGTTMRKLLGSPEYEDKQRQKLFKKAFGYYDKGVYIMMRNKFKKLFEYYIHLFESSKIASVDTDDGPGMFSSLKSYRSRAEIEAGKLGWEIAKELIDDDYYYSQDFSFVKDTEYPKGPVDSVSFGPAGTQEPSAQNLTDYVGTELWNKWLDHIDMILRNQEYEYVDTMAKERKAIVKDSPKTAKQLDAEEPEPVDVNRGNEQHDDLDIVKEVLSLAEVSKKTKIWKQRLMRRGIRIRYSREEAEKDLVKKYGGKGHVAAKKFGFRKAYYAVPSVTNKPSEKPKLVINKPEMEKLHRDKEIDKGRLKVVYKEILNSKKLRNGKELLLMGGAYGHMSHPFDDKDLTFGDLKKIIELGLGGQLNREDNVSEKLDGQNLMISWRDGKLITARNKGHLKNKGKTALDIKGVESKFKGRGDIRNAFVFAVRDLQKAIKSLSKKQQEKIFGNGSKWMNLEVLWPASENVINYDVTQIVFHGALEYDDSGRVIGQAKDSGRMLQGMIQQVNQHIQKKYKIGKPNFLTVPKHQDFGKMKDKFHGRLKKLQNQFALKDNDTLALYHQKFWEEYIYNASKQFKYKIPTNVLKRLTKRWAFFDKSYSVRDIKATIKNDKFIDWVLTTDKIDHLKMTQDNMKPFETLFFEVGAEIMKNIDGWLAVNPKQSVQKIRSKLKSSISNVRSGGDLKKLNKLKQQIGKLNSIGGLDAIVPTEGIVFKYNGKVYKFTGAFAPINQITGMMTF